MNSWKLVPMHLHSPNQYSDFILPVLASQPAEKKKWKVDFNITISNHHWNLMLLETVLILLVGSRWIAS